MRGWVCVVCVCCACLWMACGDDGGSGGVVATGDAGGDSGGAGDVGVGGGADAGDDAADDGGAQEGCATEVPCVADSDCIALAGTRCNTALEAPRCFEVLCAQEGEACSDTALCEAGLSCTSDQTCAALSCPPGSGPALVVEPETLSFGPIADGDVQTLQATLRNAGAQPLEISALVFAAETPFSLTGSTPNVPDISAPNLTLECAESWTVEVAFSPLTEGVYENALVVYSNNAASGEVSVQLQGEARR